MKFNLTNVPPLRPFCCAPFGRRHLFCIMEHFYTSLALVSSGVSLAMGSVYLYLGTLEKSATYRIFGVMGLALTTFYLLPPVGFILYDNPPYEADMIFKRIFIYSYYALTPWFILHYSGYAKRWLVWLLTINIVLSYFIMCFTPDSPEKPFWSKYALINFTGILVLGLVAGRHLMKNGNRRAAISLNIVMYAYAVLVVLTVINQLTEGALASFFNFELFFPIHFHSLLFFLVMGQHLVLDFFEKSKLETNLNQVENKLKSFVNHAPFIIMETDHKGSILSINEYGANLLGHGSASEIIDANWFDRFVQVVDRPAMQRLHHELVTGTADKTESIKTTVKKRTGELLTISWSTFRLTGGDGTSERVMGVGKDVTDEENAGRLVEQLKGELAKEQLPGLESHPPRSSEIVGTSKALCYALQKATQVAVTNAPVLLEGETGVGKELFANLIHEKSSRSKKPFIKVNCGALPKELIEDELFGHEKGAFTSAIQIRKGRFELADGGTLFLDEIGELPLDMQPKLLRVLQTGEFERLGGQKTIKVNVRLLAATNRTLSQEVQNGQFRNDLYYRLSVFPITIPSLRQRKEDLPALIQHFIAMHSTAYGKSFQQVPIAAMRRLLDYDWPGNIREMKNVIERSVILSEGSIIRFDWWDGKTVMEKDTAADNTLQNIERNHILSVMEKCNWKINGENGAAEILNMNPNTLRSRMKRLGISRPLLEGRQPQSE